MSTVDLNGSMVSNSADTCHPDCSCAYPPTLLTCPCCSLLQDTFSRAALHRSAGPGAAVVRNRPAAPAVCCV